MTTVFAPPGSAVGAHPLASARSGPGAWALAATLVLAAGLLAAIASPMIHGVAVLPEDDAEYYRVIARHIARTAVSTFDGQSLTNGYHPLWQAMLVLQERLVGSSFLITQLVEAAMVCAAFPVFLRASGLRSGLGAALFLALYARLVAGLSLTGMEVSCLVGCTALLVAAMRPEGGEHPRRGLWLGLSAALAVLARIDAAVFVLPMLALAPLPRRTRAIGLAVCAAVGGVYAAYNLAMFGSLLPISSAVKSLGGLRVNHRMLDQLPALPGGLTDRYVQTFGLLAVSPVLLLVSRPNSLGRALAGAAAIGGLLFAAKLLFASSWRLWPWYNFAVLFPLLAGAAVMGPLLEGWAGRSLGVRLPRATAPALAVLLLVGMSGRAAVALARPPAASTFRFDLLNARAARAWAGVLRGQRVAMGDRAGAFAAAYPGGVVQLEGLVNDAEYLRALKRGGDIKPLLCRRDVRFVLAYRPDLGAYGTHVLPVMRPALTQFRSPTLTLSRVDEVAHMRDRSLLDARGIDEGDDTLYLWRLACPAR